MDITDRKLPGEKKKRKKKATLRFELDLPDSTDTSCPEYSYIDLVRQTLKERESKGQNDTLCQNMLEEEEERERDEAKAIAQYFEIKYGATAAGQKRKRKDTVRDLVGAGYGYDENDPFVDDSEAYDEIVPASMTTQHGGFYINKGKLNFRAVSDDSDTGGALSDDSIPLSQHVAKKKKRRILFESDESGNEFKNSDRVMKKKGKLKSVKDPSMKKIKVSLNGKEKVPGLKQRPKKMKKSTSLAQKLVAKAKAQQMMNASGHSTNGAQELRKSLSETDGLTFKAKTSELSRLGTGDLSQVAKQATQALMSGGTTKNGPMSVSTDQNGIANTSTSSSKVINHELPPNLPQMLGDKIDSLKKIAQSSEVSGKMKFFSSDVNKILLGIDESALGLPKGQRQGMYQHLAQHLPCSKDTLLKRVKKLQEDDSDQQLKGPISKLKDAVDSVMVSQINAYLLECDSSKSEKFPEKMAASTDEDDEGEEKSAETSGEKKRSYAPRRKFKWDDNARQLLCDVVTIKVNYYEKYKSRFKQAADEYLKSFLETNVKPLWPKHWMQTRTLFKESRSAHERVTNACSKQKKATGSKKVQQTTTKDAKSDGDSLQKPDAKNSVSLSINLADAPTKKRLSFDTISDPKLKARAPPDHPKRDVVDLTTGVEIVASIEGDDFEQHSRPKPSPRKEATIHKEEPTSWKLIRDNAAASKGPVSQSPVARGSSTKNRESVTGAKSQQPSLSGIPMPSMDLVQDYASDFVKMMMGHLPGNGANPLNPYLTSGGVPNFDALSHLLDRKSDLASSQKPRAGDGKFQFKIASNSSKDDRTSKAFSNSKDTSPKNQTPTYYKAPAWPTQKNPTVTDVLNIQKYSTAPHLAGRQSKSFHATPAMQVSTGTTLGAAPDVPKPPGPRKQWPASSSKSNFIPQSHFENEQRKLNRTSPKNKSPALCPSRLQLSQPAFHPNSSAPSPGRVISHPHPVSPIVLPQFTSSGMAYSQGFDPRMAPFVASTYNPPASPGHNFPAASLQQAMNYHGIHAFPQVKLVDVKARDFHQRANDNSHGNQGR